MVQPIKGNSEVTNIFNRPLASTSRSRPFSSPPTTDREYSKRGLSPPRRGMLLTEFYDQAKLFFLFFFQYNVTK